MEETCDICFEETICHKLLKCNLQNCPFSANNKISLNLCPYHNNTLCKLKPHCLCSNPMFICWDCFDKECVCGCGEICSPGLNRCDNCFNVMIDNDWKISQTIPMDNLTSECNTKAINSISKYINLYLDIDTLLQ